MNRGEAVLLSQVVEGNNLAVRFSYGESAYAFMVVATGQGKAEQENRYTDDVVWERVTVSAATVGLSQT